MAEKKKDNLWKNRALREIFSDLEQTIKKDGRRRDFTGGIFSAVSSGHGYAESL